jgi:predicted enzyme related to lactoylglutathione lyase
MMNYLVENMDAVLEALKAEGVEVAKREDSGFGRFAWIVDPEGNRIELWEPPKEDSA